jgi:hypothetical protein
MRNRARRQLLKAKHTRRYFRKEDYIPTDVIDRDFRFQTWYDKVPWTLTSALAAGSDAHRRLQTGPVSAEVVRARGDRGTQRHGGRANKLPAK